MRPLILFKLLLPMTALALAACGAQGQAGVATLTGEDGKGAEASPAASQDDFEEELVKWADCMRENGIDIPDASVDGDGNMRITRQVERTADGSGGGSQGVVRLDESFDEAREKCGDPPRGPGAGPGERDIEELQEDALKLARCMRDNGVTDFPDPDFSEIGPGAAPQKATNVSRPFGGIDLDDPEVQAAFEKCREENGDGPFVMMAPAQRAGE